MDCRVLLKVKSSDLGEAAETCLSETATACTVSVA